MSGLAARDLDLIGQARQLADANGVDALREVTGSKGTEHAMVLANALGTAQYLLTELATLAERLGGDEDQAEDTQRLDEIRAIFAAFDWERDDRQYALEHIEMIVADDDDQADDGTFADGGR